ncbi:hypothetical protein Bca101_031924 [Brassica carinata]
MEVTESSDRLSRDDTEEFNEAWRHGGVITGMFNSFFFCKTTNPMREGAAGCWITIHDIGGEKAYTLTDHDRRRQPLQ